MKIVYLILGIIMSILGLIGVVLPILPTTPFLLLALLFFTKSSERARIYFINTNLYKNHLADFVNERSMNLKTKISLLTFASAMLLIAAYVVDNLYLRIFIVFLIIFKYYYFIFKIKTID